MSLVGFQAKNHPQQIAVNGADVSADDRGTHPEDFTRWDARFGGFTLDVCAETHNAKCARWYGPADDGLGLSWAGERVWCNPPYSALRAWVSKAWSEWPGTRGIVMLAPANRCEQVWWQQRIEPVRDQVASPLRVEFLPGRLRFERPGVEVGPKGDRPPFGCCLLIWAPPGGAW